MQRSSSLMTKGRKVRSEESDEIKRGLEGLSRTKESFSGGEETSGVSLVVKSDKVESGVSCQGSVVSRSFEGLFCRSFRAFSARSATVESFHCSCRQRRLVERFSQHQNQEPFRVWIFNVLQIQDR